MDPTANEGVSAFSGLKYFRALMEGSIARSAMLELFDINIEAAEPGGEGRLLDAKGIRLPKKSVLRHELGARGRRRFRGHVLADLHAERAANPRDLSAAVPEPPKEVR
jgi:hypothetical protein